MSIANSSIYDNDVKDIAKIMKSKEPFSALNLCNLENKAKQTIVLGLKELSRWLKH